MKAISQFNGRRVTIQRVAQEAGASPSPVSRVLAGYSVIFCSISQDAQLERDALIMLHDKVVDGIILAPVGENNYELFELHTPPITAVAQPAYAMGYKAAELLLEQLINDSLASTQVITFHPQLIVRESSQPYRQAQQNTAGF